MLKPNPMMPTVYVEAGESRLNPETIVKIVWDPSHVESRTFASLAEALEFAHSLCGDEDEAVPTV